MDHDERSEHRIAVGEPPRREELDMSDPMPESRPRGRHAAVDVPVDAPGTAAVVGEPAVSVPSVPESDAPAGLSAPEPSPFAPRIVPSTRPAGPGDEPAQTLAFAAPAARTYAEPLAAPAPVSYEAPPLPPAAMHAIAPVPPIAAAAVAPVVPVGAPTVHERPDFVVASATPATSAEASVQAASHPTDPGRIIAAADSDSPADPGPRPRVGRGILLALAVVPIGIALWVVIWNLGFIASIVGLGVAWAAVILYRAGSRSRITTGAFWALVAIILGTLALAFLAGIAADLVRFTELEPLAVLGTERFWTAYVSMIGSAELWKEYAGDLAIAGVFGALGCFGVVRAMRREAAAIA